MTPKALEKYLLALPGAKLSLQWGNDRVFKAGGKMFAVISPEGSKPRTMSFKAGEDSFHILTRMKNIIPAPYLARAQWVLLEKLDALSAPELKAYLTRAHSLVAAKLSKKVRATLGIAEPQSK